MSREVDRLANRWESGDWPKWLEWVEIHGLRGWTGQRIEFNFPIVALVGENGVGKSTVLQSAASVYKGPRGDKSHFASDFFPSTPWEELEDVIIAYSVKEGDQRLQNSVRKKTVRWRGNPSRPERHVRYIDLRRTQPIIARRGYLRITKGNVAERRRNTFDQDQVSRFGDILGRTYDGAAYALSTANKNRWVPVAIIEGGEYSGFHQGAGEATIADLLREDIPNTALVLIDEIETSLHPRAQRRLIRDLATKARLQQLQVIITTHSPYILEELPPEARVQVIAPRGEKRVMVGVSPQFAMTQMDEQPHPEADVYVEDDVAKALVLETLAEQQGELVRRIRVVPYGSSQVGKALGQMIEGERFIRPSLVFLDGDQDESPGCYVLPGGEAPERVIFSALRRIGWIGVAERLNRSHAELVDASDRAITNQNHHDWLREVGDALLVGGLETWRAMVIAWLTHCATPEDKLAIVDPIAAALGQ